MTRQEIEKGLERVAVMLEAIEEIEHNREAGSTVRRLARESREIIEHVQDALDPSNPDRTPSERLRAMLAEMAPVERHRFRRELFEAMSRIDTDDAAAAGAGVQS